MIGKYNCSGGKEKDLRSQVGQQNNCVCPIWVICLAYGKKDDEIFVCDNNIITSYANIVHK